MTRGCFSFVSILLLWLELLTLEWIKFLAVSDYFEDHFWNLEWLIGSLLIL